jgi:hypothetical protein
VFVTGGFAFPGGIAELPLQGLIGLKPGGAKTVFDRQKISQLCRQYFRQFLPGQHLSLSDL